MSIAPFIGAVVFITVSMAKPLLVEKRPRSQAQDNSGLLVASVEVKGSKRPKADENPISNGNIGSSLRCCQGKRGIDNISSRTIPLFVAETGN